MSRTKKQNLIRVIIPVSLFLIMLSLGITSGGENIRSPYDISLTEESIQAGQEIFFEYCSGCHGRRADGRGEQALNLIPKPQNLRNAQFVKYLTNERIYTSISGGVRGTAMPAFEMILSGEKRKQVISYIRSLTMDDDIDMANSIAYQAVWMEMENPIPRTAESIAVGKDRFANYCAACHGSDADGRGLLSDNLTPPPRNLVVVASWGAKPFLDYMPDARLYDSITNGVPGTSMLPWIGVMDDEERWDIINFLRDQADINRGKIELIYQQNQAH